MALVQLSPTSIALFSIGAHTQLTATALDARGQRISGVRVARATSFPGQVLRWRTSKP